MQVNTRKTNTTIKKQAEDLNRHFSKDKQMANKYMTRCSTLLIIREMQIKTTMKYHQSELLSLKNLQTNKFCKECREKETLLHCWWECKLIQPLWTVVWWLFKKLGIKLPYDPAIPLLGIYSEKSIIQKDTCTQCSQLHYLQQPERGSNLCLWTDEHIQKLWYIICNGILLGY